MFFGEARGLVRLHETVVSAKLVIGFRVLGLGCRGLGFQGDTSPNPPDTYHSILGGYTSTMTNDIGMARGSSRMLVHQGLSWRNKQKTQWTMKWKPSCGGMRGVKLVIGGEFGKSKLSWGPFLQGWG